jgi:hypothetical protein
MSGNFEFMAGSSRFKISNFGAELNPLFQRLYEAYYSCSRDLSTFVDPSSDFFERNRGNYDNHDKFFNNFTGIRIQDLFKKVT